LSPFISKECQSNSGIKKLLNRANDKTTVMILLFIKDFK
jgi:hypothetical protein